MDLIIDPDHYVHSDANQWTVRNRKGAIRTKLPRAIRELYYAHLSDLAHGLVRYGLIHPSQQQECRDAQALCQHTAERLGYLKAGSSIEFGDGRFVIEQREDGQVLLKNPTREVGCLPDRDRSGDKIFVAFCVNTPHALSVALNAVLRADSRSIPYTSLDSVSLSVAGRLFADARVIVAKPRRHTTSDSTANTQALAFA
jgi:hypothetical protein